VGGVDKEHDKEGQVTQVRNQASQHSLFRTLSIATGKQETSHSVNGAQNSSSHRVEETIDDHSQLDAPEEFQGVLMASLHVVELLGVFMTFRGIESGGFYIKLFSRLSDLDHQVEV